MVLLSMVCRFEFTNRTVLRAADAVNHKCFGNRTAVTEVRWPQGNRGAPPRRPRCLKVVVTTGATPAKSHPAFAPCG